MHKILLHVTPPYRHLSTFTVWPFSSLTWKQKLQNINCNPQRRNLDKCKSQPKSTIWEKCIVNGVIGSCKQYLLIKQCVCRHHITLLKAGALSLDSMFLWFTGHSSGWTFSVTWGKDTSTMVVMHTCAWCASFSWLCFKGIWMNAKESGTPTWSALLASRAVHLVNLMWCMTCLIGMCNSCQLQIPQNSVI